jgi:catechol 2,3-dioxygenase-like lactoylglutathione lyase family enzyme
LTWSIHRVSLATHDLAKAETFFGPHLGLGKPVHIDANTIAFGRGSRGLRVRKPARVLTRSACELLGAAGARHVAIEVEDLNQVATRLDNAAIAHVPALAGDFDVPALYTLDPASNVVAFCQRVASETAGDAIQPWEAAWGWGVHHVNLQACDVREAVAFYVEVAGMAEGRWRAPAAMGDFSIDPTQLSVLALGKFNRGLHIINPDPGFAHRNGFAHNPSIGGHPAFFVPDVKAVKARLQGAGILVSDAKVYAMAGMHQIYVQDPSANMIEVNQFV